MPSFTSSVRLSVLTTCLLALSGCNNDNNDTSPVADISIPTLTGFARLDAATFADGPTSGLGVDVEVILTRPCRFCMDIH